MFRPPRANGARLLLLLVGERLSLAMANAGNDIRPSWAPFWLPSLGRCQWRRPHPGERR